MTDKFQRSRLLPILIVILLVAGLQPATAIDSPSVSTATREGRLAVFDDVWDTILTRYYDPNFHGIDWNAKRLTFRPQAAAAINRQEFYDVLRQMIVSLRDPHTRVYSPEEKFDWWNPRFVSVGLAIRDVEGQPTVVSVTPHSPAADAQLRNGDVITTVDTVPAEKMVELRLKTLGLSREDLTRSRAISGLLDGPAGTSVAVTWETRNGKRKSATLLRSWTQKQLGYQISRDRNTVVIKIEVFTATTARNLTRALPEAMRGAESIVLDLRSNGGGDAQAMAEVGTAFSNQTLNLGSFTDRVGVSFVLQTRSLSALKPPKQTRLPMVVLINEGTSSAAEILAAVLQKSSRAQLIGTQTCGCVLAIRSRHELPDGGLLDVSELDYRTAEGRRLEGAGVRPDYFVTLSRDDLYKGHDAALKYAEGLLRNVR
jgi:carboxyl-terminal processing protease